MRDGGDERLANLARYLFTAPPWYLTLAFAIALGSTVDLAAWVLIGDARFPGTLALSIPALVSTVLTLPLLNLVKAPFTWNRSALLASSCTFFSWMIILPSFFLAPIAFPIACAVALGLETGLRLLVLAAIADARVSRVALPALTQGLTGVIALSAIFPLPFTLFSVVALLTFGVAFRVLVWAIERPLLRTFRVSGFKFLNTLLAHLTDGSHDLEGFFRGFGERVEIPVAVIRIACEGGGEVVVAVPHVHPGPLGEVGGGTIPRRFQEAFEAFVLVPHGCATHDFNLVAREEIDALTTAVRTVLASSKLIPSASRSTRVKSGSVNLLVQWVGDALFVIGTRAPDKTEDLDFALGLTFLAEGRRVTSCLAFVDAHNSLNGDAGAVRPGTRIAGEYTTAVRQAVDYAPSLPRCPLEAGASRVFPPFGLMEGIGETGISVLALRCDGQTTAYVLIDGNNMAGGVRDAIRGAVLEYVDEAEIMTTDSHVVNTERSRNPVGMHLPASALVPFAVTAVKEAVAGLRPAHAGGQVAYAQDVTVFGPGKVGQLAGTVSALLSLLAPIAIMLIVIALLVLAILALIL
jgi:putative membrane protein